MFSMFLLLISFFYSHDDLKLGTLVGTDKYGNKYFENNEYFYGKSKLLEKHNVSSYF